jgi:hypothetical protein
LNRIKALEADVRYQVDRADRAEKWLYKISVEIEQRFLAGMIVGACKYLLRRPKAIEDRRSDGEQSVPPRSAPAIEAGAGEDRNSRFCV